MRGQRKYKFTVTADVYIEAENIAQAIKLAKKVKVIGDRVGGSKHRKDRDTIMYQIDVDNPQISIDKTWRLEK